MITVGDCSKAETRVFFVERMLPRLSPRLQANLDFEKLYDAFGGKLAHWQDFIADYSKYHLIEARTLLTSLQCTTMAIWTVGEQLYTNGKI